MEYSEPFIKYLADNIKSALQSYSAESSLTPRVTDIYLQLDQQSSSILIYDDDSEIAHIDYSSYLAGVEVDADYFQAMESLLRRVLQRIDRELPLEHLPIWKPFSFVMVDKEQRLSVDLVLIDDDTILASQSLLEGVDAELDAFLAELLSDEE